MLNYLIFFAGVLTSVTILVIIKQYNKRSRAKNAPIKQSSMFQLMKVLIPEIVGVYTDSYTQALSYEDNKTFKYIEMPDKNAYWIDKNNIYYAEIKDGGFNPSEGKLSEMKNLSEQQVNKMLYIYNSLKNG